MPDPEADIINCLLTKIKELEECVKVLSKNTGCKEVEMILDQSTIPQSNGDEPNTPKNIDDYIHGMGI